jgi:hypothetical protein
LVAGTPGIYSFTAELQNFEPNTPVTLVDKFTSKQIDLSVNPQYSFVVDAPGTYNNRFLIYFKSAVGIEDNTFEQIDNFEIYAYGKQIYISTSSNIEDYSVSVFNTVGQLIIQKSFDGVSTERINIKQRGTYIVRVVADKSMKIKKVIIR